MSPKSASHRGLGKEAIKAGTERNGMEPVWVQASFNKYILQNYQLVSILHFSL